MEGMLGDWISEPEWATTASLNCMETGLTPGHMITPKPQTESKPRPEIWMSLYFQLLSCNLPCSDPSLSPCKMLALTCIPTQVRTGGLSCQPHITALRGSAQAVTPTQTPGLLISYKVQETH